MFYAAQPIAFECPSCGKKMTLSGGQAWICSMGHVRNESELKDKQVPWLDESGIWHNLDLM